MGKKFSDTLKQLRLDAGYTQKQVYEMIGVPQSTFSSWEIGKAEPSADILLRLCKIYGVDDILAAFGYNGYKEDGSIMLNIKEQDIIEKYRTLNEHGKQVVDFLLQKEYENSNTAPVVQESPTPEPEEKPEHLIPLAAHARDDQNPEGVARDIEYIKRRHAEVNAKKGD